MTQRSGTSRTSAPATGLRRSVWRDPRFLAAVQAPDPDPDWRSASACRGRDPEVFFPSAADDHTPALALCRLCSVRGTCLAAALENGEQDGVWGGTTPDERRAMRPVWLVRSH